jgi:hypothetical protein
MLTTTQISDILVMNLCRFVDSSNLTNAAPTNVSTIVQTRICRAIMELVNPFPNMNKIILSAMRVVPMPIGTHSTNMNLRYLAYRRLKKACEEVKYLDMTGKITILTTLGMNSSISTSL